MKFSAFFISILFSSLVFAEQVCFGTAEEHDKVKEKLPVMFQTLPVTIGVDSPGMIVDVFVILKIQIQAPAIVFITDLYATTEGRVSDKVEVKNLCYDTVSKALKVEFNNNAKPFDAVYGNNTVTTRGVVLKKLTAAEQKAIRTKLESKPKAQGAEK